jgi:hypothetical protein
MQVDHGQIVHRLSHGRMICRLRSAGGLRLIGRLVHTALVGAALGLRLHVALLGIALGKAGIILKGLACITAGLALFLEASAVHALSLPHVLRDAAHAGACAVHRIGAARRAGLGREVLLVVRAASAAAAGIVVHIVLQEKCYCA